MSKPALMLAKKLSSKGGKAALHVNSDYLLKSEVRLCRSWGIPLGVWTLDDETEVRTYNGYISTFTVDALVAERIPRRFR